MRAQTGNTGTGTAFFVPVALRHLQERRTRLILGPQGQRGMIRTGTAQALSSRKTAGGFCLIPVRDLAGLWWAYQQKLIRFIDLRAALAAREMDARRCLLPNGRGPCFSIDELAKLTRSSARNLRPSLARLQDAEFLRFSDTAIEFPEASILADDPEFEAWLLTIANHRRRVPVPRRILRSLAQATGPVRIATILGCLFRCAYQRGQSLALRGRIKASWIAHTFGVNLRRVKAARQELVQDGWLLPDVGDNQAAMNRWGRAYTINPQWGEPEALDILQETPPLADPDLDLPPPKANREPLPRSGNQKPAAAGGDGVDDRKRGGDRLPQPDLRRVRAEDLRDPGRTLELHRQAVTWGLVTASESDQLKILAAAERARSVGRENPAGLFFWLVGGKHWEHLTAGHEEAASRRLKTYLNARPTSAPVRSGPLPACSPPSLSADANLVRLVQSRLGGRSDAYHTLRRESSDWTRERYERALLELEGSKRTDRPETSAVPAGVSMLGFVLGRLGIGLSVTPQERAEPCGS